MNRRSIDINAFSESDPRRIGLELGFFGRREEGRFPSGGLEGKESHLKQWALQRVTKIGC